VPETGPRRVYGTGPLLAAVTIAANLVAAAALLVMDPKPADSGWVPVLRFIGGLCLVTAGLAFLRLEQDRRRNRTAVHDE
jgi:hypothetical protein